MGIFEYELRLVFFLLKLHECTHMAQLILKIARGGGDKVLVSQRYRDLITLGFDNGRDAKAGFLTSGV